MKILLLDNYDSFTYNLAQLITENSTCKLEVRRNDEITLDEVEYYDKVVLSPGPGLPKESGILCDLIQSYYTKKPIFGVCLGMQAIAEVFGGKLINLEEPMHGVSTSISHTKSKLFKNIPEKFSVGRYHSWAVEPSSISSEFTISAVDKKGIVMAIEHQKHKLSGVQFHPESILTEQGKTIIINFLNQ